MNINWHAASFIKSAQKSTGFPDDTGHEVAFVGRSNAGKSSLINGLCKRRALCKVGKAPGKTRLINFFSLGDTMRLVDLPGYGYAKVSHSMRDQWRDMIEAYLLARKSLRLLVVVMDIRHPLQEKDSTMLAWAWQHAIPTYAVLTKSDKLSNMQVQKQCIAARKQLSPFDAAMTGVQSFSALQKQGIDTLARHIEACLEMHNG